METGTYNTIKDILIYLCSGGGLAVIGLGLYGLNRMNKADKERKHKEHDDNKRMWQNIANSKKSGGSGKILSRPPGGKK